MSFQSTVRAEQTSGVVGEMANEGPLRAVTAELKSTGVTSASANIVGRACTYVSSSVVAAGGTATSEFAGILANPKTYALSGTSAGTLVPTLLLPEGTQVELIRMGEMFVSLSAAANVGDLVEFETTTGALSPVAALVQGVGSIATTTLTVASVSSGAFRVGSPVTGPNVVPGTVITALGTGTGGAGTYTVSVSQTAASAAVFGQPLPSASTRRLVPNCKVARIDSSAAGLAIVALTN